MSARVAASNANSCPSIESSRATNQVLSELKRSISSVSVFSIAPKRLSMSCSSMSASIVDGLLAWKPNSDMTDGTHPFWR